MATDLISANARDREAIIAAAEDYPGSSPSWIARKIGVSKGQAYYHMTKAGYWPSPDAVNATGGRGNPFTEFEDERIQDMRLAGANYHEIGRAIIRHPSSVRMRLLYLASREG